MDKKKPRQRVSAACHGCRTRRTKCDGNPTQCSACLFRNQACEYSQSGSNRKPPSKTYVRALEARVEALEQELAAIRQGSNTGTGTPSVETRHSRMESTGMARDSDLDLDLDVITDTLGSFNIGDGGTLCYFGSRSNLNFLRGDVPRLAGPAPDMQRREPSSLDAVADELRAHLLDLFWTWQNSWQRIVPRDYFLHDLHTHPSFPRGNFSSPALLCAIYALASRYSDRPELRADAHDATTAGNAFAADAKQMLMHECEAPSTSTVQAAALVSIREASVHKDGLGWMYCGMAIRLALGLGLHLDCSRCVQGGVITASEAEVRSVTWWGCYMLERLWNVGLGRPPMIQDREVTAPMPLTDCTEERLPCPASRVADPAQTTTRTLAAASCSIYTCKLFISSAELLDSIYAPAKKTENHEAIVSDAHLRLVAFYNQLPASFKMTRSPRDVFPPNVYLLHLQYHTTMILLHRPYMVPLRTTAGAAGGLQSGNLHASTCQKSAEWIAAIFRWYRGHYGLRKIPVSAIHCAFTAAITFLAIAAAGIVEVRARAMKSLKCLYQALGEMQTAWSWSTRAMVSISNIARAWKVDMHSAGAPSSGAASVPPAETRASPEGPEGELLGGEMAADLLFEPFLDFSEEAHVPSWDSFELFSLERWDT